ncbi:alpha-2-macroglobulin [Cetorhinus maximus]
MQTPGILLCLLLTAVRTGGRYVVLIPAELRSGSLENVCVLMLQGSRSWLLTLSIQNTQTNTTLLQRELRADTGPSCFTFTVEDSEVTSDSISLVKVSVRGSADNLTIDESRLVVLKKYSSPTFIQTDKAVYKPGQTVKFRIVSLNEKFIPIQEKYPLVSLWDPSSNRIGQWRDVESRQGIAELSFDLLPEPIQGFYRIEAQKKEGKSFHQFSVEEYVLPKAELKLKIPKQITLIEPKIHVEVCGSYTFGKPVMGFVNGTVCLQYDFSPNACQRLFGQTDSNGCLSDYLPMKLFRFNRRHYSRRLVAHFVLKEEGTGIPMQAFAETEVTSDITRIKFKDEEKYFKTGLPYTGQIQLEYSTGSPLSNATIYLFNTLSPGATKVITDDLGIARFSLNTSSWGSTPISFTAIYQASHQDYRYRSSLPHHEAAQLLALPFYSRSRSYLSIRKDTQALPCYSQLEVSVYYIIQAQLPPGTQTLDIFYLVRTRVADPGATAPAP